MLVAQGADVNERRVWGTPLSIAMGQKLLPMHSAIENIRRDDEIIRVLKEAGAKSE